MHARNHGWSAPSMMPKVSPPIPNMTVVCPVQSKGLGCFADLGTLVKSARAIAPTGMLMRKTRRQSDWVRAPPITGPAAVAIEPPNAHLTIAFPRSVASGKDSRINPRELGVIIAAPSPCRILPTIRRVSDGARAQAIEAPMKMAIPIPNVRLAPMPSERVPQNS